MSTSTRKNVRCIGENIFAKVLMYIKKNGKEKDKLDATEGKNEERECWRLGVWKLRGLGENKNIVHVTRRDLKPRMAVLASSSNNLTDGPKSEDSPP
jgi:hypothetical protein